MYSRNYYQESSEAPTLPQNYDGTTFMDKPREELQETAVNPTPQHTSEASIGPKRAGELVKIPFLSNLFDGDGLKLPTIGVEEILILATAAFLFFSKEGDKESAIILLLLLLIN